MGLPLLFPEVVSKFWTRFWVSAFRLFLLDDTGGISINRLLLDYSSSAFMLLCFVCVRVVRRPSHEVPKLVHASYTPAVYTTEYTHPVPGDENTSED